MEAPSGSEKFNVLPDDLEKVSRLTSLYANRLFVQTLENGLVRLNFGEIHNAGDPRYHTSVVLTCLDAIEFAQLIYNMSSTSLAAHERYMSEAAAAERGDG